MTSRPLVGAAAGAILLTALAVPSTAVAATAAGNAQLAVLHGIPNLPVDVWVDGTLTLDDFQPTTLSPTLSLPAATYSVAVTEPDAASATEGVLIGPADLTLTAGGNFTAVAHLTADGTPTLTPFANDVTPTAAGQGRLTVRHTAAAPAVDILAGGSPVITNLVNPNEQILNLPAGTISASVAATGTTEPVIGPADVAVQEGVNTIVYAIGSLEDDTLTLAVQTISGLATPPAGVPAGQTGEAALAGSAQQWIGFGAFGLLLAAAAAALITRRTAAARR